MRKQRLYKSRLLIVLTAGLVLLAGASALTAKDFNSREVDGRIENGLRVIEALPDDFPVSISVYRGDTVQLTIAQAGQPFSISIPEYKINESSLTGQGLAVKFKAKKLGDFPFYYRLGSNGGREKSGRIMVRQYESSKSAIYKEFSAEQAKAFITEKAPLILDVRTTAEYMQGRIDQSTLIPVQELARRLSEIEQYKENDIIIYCRSGNRSTVAAAIMERNGFKRLYNLRYGIIDWARRGLPIVK